MSSHRALLRTFLIAAAASVAPAMQAATITWDGVTTSYALTTADTFTYTAGTVAAGGVSITGAQDLDITGNLTLGGAFSFVQSGGGSYPQGIELVGASSTITATAITLTGDIGKQNSDGNSLTLDTSAANGTIDLNVSLGRSGVWYIPSAFTANAGAGTITVSGTGPGSAGWRSTPVSLTGGAINITSAVSSNAAVTLNNSATSTVSGVLSGSMSLTKGGAGTMTISSRGTYTGSTTVSSGTLRLADARSLSGAATVSSGATLQLENNANGGYFQPASLTVNGGTVSSVLVSANRYHGIYTTAITTSGTSSIGTPIYISKSGTTTNEVLTINVTGGTTTISGSVLNHPDLSGGGFTKTGAGTLILSGGGLASGNSSTLTGNIIVSQGELQVNSAAGSTSTSALGDLTTAGRTVTISSGATLKFTAYDTLGAYNYATPVTFIADGGTLATSAFGSIGSVTLKNGAHFTIGNGTGTSFIKSLEFNGTLTVNGTSGSFIDVAAGAATNVGFQLLANGGSTTFNVASTGDATADLTVTAPLTDSVNSAITGLSANTLIKAGAGKMVLNSANSYSGGTTLRAGTIVAANNSALGTSGTVTLNDASTSTANTTLLIDATAGGVTIGRAITVANQGSGTVTLGSASTANANQAVFSGAITLNRATTLTGGSAGDRLGFTGGITGTANVTIAGTNRVVFSGTSTNYAGTTTIGSGSVLQLSDGTGTATSYLNDSYDVTVNGTLNLAKGTNSETIAGLNGSGVVDNLVGGVTSTLVVGSGNAAGSFSGVLKNTNGTLALTKTGTGTQTLSGANTFTGVTTVSNGTLSLASGGSLASGSAVSVASGATLSVASGASVNGLTTVASGGTATANGTLAGVTVNSGGTLRGSGSVGAVTVNTGTGSLVAGTGTSGTLTLASLTFDGSGALNIGAASSYTSATAFVVTGALTLNGGAGSVALNLPSGGVANGTYKLLAYGSTTATLSQFSLTGPTVSSRQSGQLQLTGSLLQYVVSGDSPVWTGANGTAFSGGSNWKLITAGTATDFIAADNLLLDDTATATTVDISGGNVAPAMLTFDNSASNYILQGTSGVSSGALVKSGTGSLTVSNANTFTSTAINAGSLVLNNGAALGTGTVTLSGGTLDLNGQSTSAAVVLNGGSIAGSGTLAGVVSGGTLAKSGSTTLKLTNANTFTATTLSAGTLQVGSSDALGGAAATLALNGGALSSDSTTARTLTAAGASTIGGNFTLGDATNNGALTLANAFNLGGATRTLTTASNATLSGVLSNGGLTKAGNGTLTLANANTYSGGTTLSAGTLVTGNGAALGTGSVALNGGALNVNGQTLANAVVLGGGSVAGAGTLSGVVSGSGALTKSDNTSLTLSNANTYSGGTTLSAGTLVAGNGAALGTGSVGLNGGVVDVNGQTLANAFVLGGGSFSGAGTLSGALSGSGTFTKSGAGTLTLTNNSNFDGSVVVSAGTLQLNDARQMNGAVTVSSGATLTLQNNANGGYYQPTALTVNGATINSVVSSSNRYHGIYTEALNFGSGTSSFSVPLYMNAVGDANAHTLVVTADAGATATVSGVIASHPDTNLAVNGNVTKNGNGILILSGANTFKGNLVINGGELRVGATANNTSPTATALGDMTQAGRTVTVNAGATLRFVNSDAIGQYNHKATTAIVLDGGTLTRDYAASMYFNSLGDITLRNGARVTTANGGGATVQSFALNGTVTVSGTSGSFIDTTGSSFNGLHLGTVGGSTTFNVGDTADLNDLTVSAPLVDVVLGGAAGLVKAGAGRMVLTGASSYSGGTTLRAGSLVAANASAFGTSGTVTVNDGSTGSSDTSLLIDATAGNVSLGRAITVANQGTGTVTLGGATTAGSNQATFSGAVTLNKDVTLLGTAQGDRTEFTGGLSGAGAVTVSGAGRVIFRSTANTFAGATTVASGATLQLSDGTATSASYLADAANATVNGTLSLAKGGNSETIAGLAGTGSVRAIASADTLVVGNGNATATFSGVLGQTGAGTLALTKVGTGVQTLSGANTYTGATSVNNGTLAIGSTGSLAAGSAVTVANGATLSVAAGGAVSGTVTVNSGGALSAAGTLGGALNLTGSASVSGTVTGLSSVANGGVLTAASGATVGAVNVASGGALAGSGSVGAVTVANGSAVLTAGSGGSGTLSLSSLTFDGTGSLAFGNLSNYTNSAAFSVGGTLALNGGNVSLALPAGVVSNGTYSLISFGNTTATDANFTLTGPTQGARQTFSLVRNDTLSVFQFIVSGFAPVWTGANSGVFNGGSNWTASDGSGATDYVANDSLLFDDTATGTTAINLSGGDVAPLSVSFANSALDYTLGGTSSVTGGTFAKSGTGTVTVNNANTFSASSISGGTVVLGNAGALGTSAVTLSGGSLNLNGQTIANGVVLAGGAIAGNGEISGVVSGSGSLAKSAAGTLTLSGQNTFTGGTTVSNGTLALGHATDTLADTGAVTVSGGELSLGANSDAVGAVTLSSGSITGSGTLTGSAYDVRSGTVDAKLAGSAVALAKTTSGTVTLNGANTYTGGTTVSAGTLVAGNNAALGTGSVALNGGTLSVGSGVTAANGVTLGGGSLAGAGTLSGVVSGSSTLTKAGNDTLTLSGASTFTGGVDVTAGTLAVSGTLGSGAYSGNIAVSSGATAALTSASNQTLSGVVSGAGALTKAGNGILTLSGSNTFTGNLVINGGELRVGSTANNTSPTATALGNMSQAGRTVTVNAGATLRFVNSDAIGQYNHKATTAIILDGGTLIRDYAASMYFNSLGDITLRNGAHLTTANGGNAVVQSYALNGTVTVAGASGSFIDTVGSTLNGLHLGTVGGSTTFNVGATGDANADLTVSAPLVDKVLGGAAGLVKSGNGRMVLTGANTYTGSTTISTGTLAIGPGGGIYRGAYSGSSVSIGSGATLEVQTWNYNESTGSLGGLTANTGGLSVNGGTIRVVGASPTSYGRGVTVNSGGVTLEAGAGANWTIDTVNDSNAWAYNGNPSMTFGGAGTGTFNKNITLGSGSVTKNGAGTWTLGGTNSFSGGLTVNAGSLVGTSASAYGSGAIVVNGGSLNLGGFSLANAITLNGGSLSGASGLSGSLSFTNATLTFGGLSSFGTAAITVGSGATLDLATLNPNNAVTLAGGDLLNYANWTRAVTLAGAASASLVEGLASSSITVVAGANVDLGGVSKNIIYQGGTLTNLGTYTGALTVQGALDLSVATPVGNILLQSGSVDFGGRTTGGNIVYSGGVLSQAGGFTGNVSVTGTGVALTAGAFGAGTIVVGNGTSVDIGSGFTNDIRLSGGSIVGSSLNNLNGTVTLGTGQTLDLDGPTGNLATTATNANVTLESGSTLKGIGAVGAVTVQSGGILAPGNSPGYLMAESMTLLGGGTFTFEVGGLEAFLGGPPVAGEDYDTINVFGELNLSSLSSSSRFVLNLVSLTGTATGDLMGTAYAWNPEVGFELTLFSYGTLNLGGNADLGWLFSINSQNFVDASLASVSASQFSVYNNIGANEIRLVYSAPVPEPSTYGILLGGLALAAAALRRRRKAV